MGRGADVWMPEVNGRPDLNGVLLFTDADPAEAARPADRPRQRMIVHQGGYWCRRNHVSRDVNTLGHRLVGVAITRAW